MRKVKKILVTTLLAATLILVMNPTNVMANSHKINSSVITVQAMPRPDIIEWRYKSEGGKAYRRLYNYSREQWVGEWELVS